MANKMPDAYRMRERHNQLRKRDKVKHPISGEAVGLGAHDRSLEQIFGEPREADLFLNLYLHKKNPATAREIVRKRAAEPKPEILNEAEEKFLEDNRESFNMLRAESDLMRDLLNGEQLTRMQSSDKDIDEIIGMIGPDNSARFLGDQLEELALADETRFRRIVESLKAADEVQGSKQTEYNEQRIAELLQKYGVTKEQFEEATVQGMAPQTMENLTKVARAQLPGWRQTLEYFNFGTVSKWRAGKLRAAFAERERLLQEADVHLAPVVKVLRGTLSREEIKRSYQNQGFAEGTAEPTRYTIMSIDNYRRLKKEFALETIEDDFKGYRAREAKKFGRNKYWNEDGTSNITDDQKNRVRDQYLKDKKAKKERQTARGLMDILKNEVLSPVDPSRTYEDELDEKINNLA